jgi:hypothetical protein
MSKGTLVFIGILGAAVVHAQSMNVDFNFAGVSTAPSSGYAAAGLAGVWNTANMTGNTVPTQSLVDLSGTSTAATLNVPVILGNWSNFGSWTGDDMLLMDDSGGSVGQTVNFSGLLNGNYDVYVYGMSATGNVNSSFYIGSATQNNTGGWTGSHVLGASYGLFSAVSVTSGTLQIGWVGNFNGVQLVYSPVPEPATLSVLALGALAVLRKRQKHS